MWLKFLIKDNQTGLFSAPDVEAEVGCVSALHPITPAADDPGNELIFYS